jgi:thioredoxin reductase
MPVHQEEMIIIGGGPAGYTAAIYAARAGRNPLLLSGLQPGGQLMITSDVENYPGYADSVQGPWLMEQMREQAARVGVRIVEDIVVSVDLSRRPFQLALDGGDSMNCNVLIIATGAQAKWLGVPSEQRFRGQGVSACATCDGFFFRAKRVAIVGVRCNRSCPCDSPFNGQLSMRPGGHIEVVPGSPTTSVPGVFAAGDVADDVFRQAVTAAGLGCMAALEADRFLIRQGADQNFVPA